MAKNEVMKTETGAVAEQLPDWMKDMRGMGSEQIGADDIAIPRVALMQLISPQVADGLAKPGTFYHLTADQDLGQTLRMIPIIISKSFMLWRPKKSGGGILARADDGIHWTPGNATFNVTLDSGKQVVWETKPTVKESGLDAWGSSDPSDPNALPAATKMVNVLMYLPDFPELSPSVFTLQRSSMKPGKKFLGKLQMSSAPSFGMQFTVGFEKVTGAKGDFFSPTFTQNGFVSDQGLFSQLKDLYTHFKEVGVKVKEDGLDEEGGEGGTGGETAGGNTGRDF